MNYMRVLTKVKCNSCGHKGYDADFEDYEIKIVSEIFVENFSGVTSEMKIRHTCPKCKKENTMVYTEKNR